MPPPTSPRNKKGSFDVERKALTAHALGLGSSLRSVGRPRHGRQRRRDGLTGCCAGEIELRSLAALHPSHRIGLPRGGGVIHDAIAIDIDFDGSLLERRTRRQLLHVGTLPSHDGESNYTTQSAHQRKPSCPLRHRRKSSRCRATQRHSTFGLRRAREICAATAG